MEKRWLTRIIALMSVAGLGAFFLSKKKGAQHADADGNALMPPDEMDISPEQIESSAHDTDDAQAEAIARYRPAIEKAISDRS